MTDEKRIRKSYEKAAEVMEQIKVILKNVIDENVDDQFIFVVVHSIVVANVFSDYLYIFSRATKKFNLSETVNEVVASALKILMQTIERNKPMN